MNKLLAFLFVLFVSHETMAQQSVLRLPRDSANNPLMAGLGLPYLFETTITNTAYDVSARFTLPTTGADLNRQWRHLKIFNLSVARSIYICAGDSTGCTRDMWKVRPGTAMVDDYAYFGPANNVSHIYYRIDAAGSVGLDLGVW